jgi:hypothetical protein
MKESAIEGYLVDRVVELGGEVRKVRWIGRNGAPDRVVMLDGKTIFIELKRPGQTAKPHQIREHERMRRMGQRVEVADSFEQIDRILNANPKT